MMPIFKNLSGAVSSMDEKELMKLYESKKSDIRKRLDKFELISNQADEKLFSELAFCILVPQSKAITSWNAVKALEKNGLLLKGDAEKTRPFLQAIRFPENKNKYLMEARQKFIENGNVNLKDKFGHVKDNPVLFREWLLDNVKGLGMKETSHFIRNIGLSKNKLAILDVHILKNLKEMGIIDDIPKSLTKKIYLEIEEKMKDFCDNVGVELDEMDLLLWSKETGFIFK